MTDTFNWPPLVGPAGAGTFRVRSNQFGDGYKQVVADGLNTESQSWPLTFLGYNAKVAPILAFLRAHPGYVPFYWTPPLGVRGLYTCAGYVLTPQGGDASKGEDVYQLQCTFDEYFVP